MKKNRASALPLQSRELFAAGIQRRTAASGAATSARQILCESGKVDSAVLFDEKATRRCGGACHAISEAAVEVPHCGAGEGTTGEGGVELIPIGVAPLSELHRDVGKETSKSKSMRFRTLLWAILIVVGLPLTPPALAAAPGIVAINHTYEARIRFNGKVTTTQVQASDAGQAKKMVQAQFGPSATVLSVKRVD